MWNVGAMVFIVETPFVSCRDPVPSQTGRSTTILCVVIASCVCVCVCCVHCVCWRLAVQNIQDGCVNGKIILRWLLEDLSVRSPSGVRSLVRD